MYKPNPISKISSYIAQFINTWTAIHMMSGSLIAFVLDHLTDIPNIGILISTFIIAVLWEIIETQDYSTIEEMYNDYGGKKSWQRDTCIDIVIAVVMAALIIY